MSEPRSEEPREAREEIVSQPSQQDADLHERLSREWSLYERYVRHEIEIRVAVTQRLGVGEPRCYIACFTPRVGSGRPQSTMSGMSSATVM